jgi:hypothetical protein
MVVDPELPLDLVVGGDLSLDRILVHIGNIQAVLPGNLAPGAEMAMFSEKPFAGRFQRGWVIHRLFHLRA